MRRLMICTTAVLAFLAWSTLGKTSNSLPAAKPKVTIVFRGLLVFHPDPARQYFEAGILRAPEHNFRIEVRETSATGVSSFVVPTETQDDVWSFEFAGAANRGVNYYQNGAFNRKAGIGDARDFRWAVDFEGKEFYNQQLATKQNQLGPIMRVTSGEFYTKTRTVPLLRNRGNGTFEYFGSAADEVAANLFADGDIVLRSSKSGKEILRLKDKPDTTYEVVVENEFMTEAQTNAGHFSYYYRLINKPRDEWYDFKAADNTVVSGHHLNHAFTPGSNRVPCMPLGFGKRQDSLK